MNKPFYNPVKIEFGRNSLEFLPRYIEGRKALLLTSKGFEERGVVASLEEKNPNIIFTISTVQPNPTIIQVEEIRKQVEYEQIEVIVALGGGSVIDVAKAVAPFANNKSLMELLINGVPNDIHILPIIAIPTTAGTGSEVTMWGTIWDDVNKKKYSIMDERLYCEAAILDPMLHITIPYDITIQTGLDALSHSLESIWNKNNKPISTIYAKRAITEILEVLPLVADDLNNIAFRERMLLASYHAGLAFSNTQTAIAHAISYYLTLEKGIPHGIAASITLPTILDVYLKDSSIKNNYDFINEALKEKVERLFLELNISLDLNTYKINEVDIDYIEHSLRSISRAQNSVLNQLLLFSEIKLLLKNEQENK
ncbi:phosphonoacetaldehyde reductase [Solibacillus daqui]|uniref:phosphonoacetaldehyde reductase n=1 Tax=Solibacillus daqui TaxID=2912187 RepID=UPI0023654A3C|nr:phosphonoacetaldehyde reductase [Solibacillus daqui]